jgi:hypothetical protein
MRWTNCGFLRSTILPAPAIATIKFVSPSEYVDRLHQSFCFGEAREIISAGEAGEYCFRQGQMLREVIPVW